MLDKRGYVKFLEEMTKSYELNRDIDDVECVKVLFKIENKFRSLIQSGSRLKVRVYKDFIKYIKEEKGNLLHTKMYFREREAAFIDQILDSVREEDYEALYDCNISFRFMKWVLSLDYLPNSKIFESMYEKYTEIRRAIIERNLPLVVNRSRLFQIKSRKHSEDPLEFVQTASEGFIHALDKFTPDSDTFSKRELKGPMIGWIQSKLLEESGNSRSPLKTSTTDKRVMYRINMARYRLGYTDMNKILDFVREKYPKTTMKDIGAMISSELMVSIDRTAEQRSLYSSAFSVDSAEEGAATRDLLNKVEIAASVLPVKEIKILVLKGGIDGKKILPVVNDK